MISHFDLKSNFVMEKNAAQVHLFIQKKSQHPYWVPAIKLQV